MGLLAEMKQRAKERAFDLREEVRKLDCEIQIISMNEAALQYQESLDGLSD